MTSEEALQRAQVRERYSRIVFYVIVIVVVIAAYVKLTTADDHIIQVGHRVHHQAHVNVSEHKSELRKLNRQFVINTKRRDRINAREFKKLYLALTTGKVPNFTVMESPEPSPTQNPQGHQSAPSQPKQKQPTKKGGQHSTKPAKPKPSPSPTSTCPVHVNLVCDVLPH